jgi:hypothetical protein
MLAKLDRPQGSGQVREPVVLVVARGHGNLVAALRGVLGDLRGIEVIEDRRRDGRLLPRERRGGRPAGLVNPDSLASC